MEQRNGMYANAPTVVPPRYQLPRTLRPTPLPEPSLAAYIEGFDAQRSFAETDEEGYLDYVARHGGWYHILHSDEAQDAFARRGEEGYRQYVRGQFMHRLQPDAPFVITRKPQGRSQSAAQPAQEPSPAQPTPQLLFASINAPTQHTAPSANPPRQPAPDTIVNPDIARAHDALLAAADEYAQITARQRSGHYAALLEGNRAWQVMKSVLNPIATMQARREAGQASRARAIYQARLNDYVAELNTTTAEAIKAKLDVMALFERRVLQFQEDYTRSAVAADGTRDRTWADRARLRLTQVWLDTSRPGKVLMVGVLPAAVGLTVGALTVAGGLPALAVAGTGIAVTYAGRSIGGGIARSVNRYQIATDAIRERTIQRAEMRRIMYASRYVSIPPGIDPMDVDVTEAYTEGTRQAAHENARRLGLAQLIGSLAAAGGFGIGRLAAQGAQAIGENMQAPIRAGTPNTPPPATQTPPTVPTPKPYVPNINPNQYPWDVASQMHHGNPLDTIKAAAAQYNAAYGTHLQLVPHPNGTVWLQDGSHPLNIFQQLRFNLFMEQAMK